MKAAVISDIHGNIKALTAVLEDLKKRGIRDVYCAGDLVGYAPFPNEVIDLIRAEKIPTVMGNYDDGVGFDRPECGCAYPDPRSRELGQLSIDWTKKMVTGENKKFLQTLPARLELKLDDFKVMIVHGSPRKINEYLFADKPEQTLKRVVEQSGADVLVCGHTHQPFHKIWGAKHLVNAGSMGKPKHGDPHAVYAILSAEQNKLAVDFVKVAYDVESVATAIEQSDLPNEFAVMLREGRG